jgi:hypothetical protein
LTRIQAEYRTKFPPVSSEGRGLDAKLVNAYLGGSIGDDMTIRYKRAFATYRVGAADRFAVVWSWPGFFFGVLHLIHRRAYRFALMSFGAQLILNLLFPGIGTLIGMSGSGLLNNYLIYRQFQRSLQIANAASPDRSDQIKVLKALGGMNTFTATVIGLGMAVVGIALIVLVVVVVLRFLF